MNPAREALRVLLFTDADVFAGTERHMLDLARGLRDCGVAARIACPSPAALETEAARAGLPVLTIQKRGLLDRAAARTLARLLRAGEIDIVHAHNGRTALAAAAAVALAGRGQLVTTQHFLEPNHATLGGGKAILSGLAHRWVARRTSRVVAISEATRRAALARRDVPDGKITVVPNGISPPDAALLDPAPVVRRSLGVDATAPLVVCAARLEREKDIASLVDAMGRVTAALPAARCVIAGDGSQRAALEARIQAQGLRGAVRLLGFRPDALSLIAAADVFALPSLAEPFGLAILEAMALARPVVATAAGGPLEIVVDGETGLLVPPAAPDALAAALESLLRDPAACRRLGRNGWSRYRERFTADRMAQATLAVYREAVAAEAAPPHPAPSPTV